MRPRRWLIVVAGSALAFTLLVSVTSVVHFAYSSPSLHVAVETAAALISLLGAQLVYHRFRRSLDRADLLLTAALALFAGANLLFSAIPEMANVRPGHFTTWAPLLASTVATALLAASAFAPPRRERRPVAAARRGAWLVLLALVVIGVATALAGDLLPRAIQPGLSPESATRPRIVGPASILVLQLVAMGLFAAAAFGFARRAQRTGDALLLWLAIGSTLGAFARLNYFLFPSQYSDYFYTGDVLRLGLFIAVLAGGAHEIRVTQRELQRGGVLEERRRMAREIHDGMAQDLAFIVQQAGMLAARDGADRAAAEIATAAQRALDESRGVISVLVRPVDEPLAAALARVARDTAARFEATVETDIATDVELAAPIHEALLRVVSEAVSNAARHADAGCIRVELTERPQLQLRVIDDGVGFDPVAVEGQSGRHGITAMRERAEAVGGRLFVHSKPGLGTEIAMVLP